MNNFSRPNLGSANPLQKVVALVISIVLAGLMLMFSAVVFAFILVIGLLAWGYVWWKTRKIRKQMRDFSPQSVVMENAVDTENVYSGEVIEGEVIHVVETEDKR